MNLKWRVYSETHHNEVINAPVTIWVGDVYDKDALPGHQVVYSAIRNSPELATRDAVLYWQQRVKA